MIGRCLRGIAFALATLVVTACGDDPLGSGSGATDATVRFSLADITMSSGLSICDEGTDVSLNFSQEQETKTRGPKTLEVRPSCGASFDITIKKDKRADFTGEISGNGRPLMTGSASLRAEDAKDGFRVVIDDLRELPALNITTQTQGFGGTAQTYTARVRPAVPGLPIQIDRAQPKTVGAVAAGPATVSLDAGNCTANAQTVDVPPSSEIVDVRFDVVCGPGDLQVEVITLGSPAVGPPNFLLDLEQQDPATPPHSQSDVSVERPSYQEQFNIPSGNYLVRLNVEAVPPGSPSCTVAPPGPVREVFLPAAGSQDVRFEVSCLPIFRQEFITITTSTAGSGTPYPPFYSYTVVDAANQLIDQGSIGNNDTKRVEFLVEVPPTAQGPYDVTVFTGSQNNCFHENPPNDGTDDRTHTVQVPVRGTAVFPIECGP